MLCAAKQSLRGLIRKNHARFGKRSLYHWKPSRAGHATGVNFGDELFPLIVARILGRAPRQAHSGPNVFARLLAGGSILEHARECDTVWGVGSRLGEGLRCRSLDVRAVRGPLTHDVVRKSMGACPEVFGDPAILLPALFPEWEAAPVRGRIGFVPHHGADEKMYAGRLSSQMTLIRPDQEPSIVVKQILQCELVISSSLHGVIVAEAFEIPARWLADYENAEPHMKYYDYYLSTNRSPRAARSIAEAERLGGEPLPGVAHTEALLAAFPRDLPFAYAD
jgi:pyruvyltransferase